MIPPVRDDEPWGGTPIFKGVRTFLLKPRTDGSTDFAMTERFRA